MSFRSFWDALHFKGSPDPSHFIFKIYVGKRRIRHRTNLDLNSLIFNRFSVDLEIQFQSHSMSDPTLCDIDFKNKMAWVWTTLKTNRVRDCKVGCVFTMVVVCILPHAEFGLNDQREDAPHFTVNTVITVQKEKPILSSLTMPARSNTKLIHGWPKIWIHWMKMSVHFSLNHQINLFQISGRMPKSFHLAQWQVEMIHHLVVEFDQSALVCFELLVHFIKNSCPSWWPHFETQIQTLFDVSFQITIRDQVLLHHILF